MSEEAVRQTRSQKRALEREAAPQSMALSNADYESKKPKLDPSEPASGVQTKPKPELLLAQDTQSRTRPGSDPETEPEPEQSRLPLPLVLPPTSQLVKDDRDRTQKNQTAESGSDNRILCNDRARMETAVDPRSRLRQTEPKASGGILAAGEVKATIKVEVQTEQPVDMSTTKGIKREKRPPSPEDDDVIILSDNDSPSPPMNGLSHLKELDTELLMKSSPAERKLIIKQLREELRLQEARLVLLKKLRQSQIQRDTLQKPSGLSGSSAPPPLIRGTIASSKGSQQILTGRSLGTVIPPPLVRGGQQASSKHGSQIIMPPLVRGAQQIHALRQQQQQQQLAATGGSGSGPPPLLLGPRNSATAQGQRGVVQSGLIRVGNNANLLASPSGVKGSSLGSAGVSVVSVNDSPASRQAAAKLALRKQLEKTLLEIPPPKPPAPEFNFLPSAANNEFIYLVGLEEVVQNLLDTIHRGKTGVPLSMQAVRDPFICTQCNTDFTCRWRQDKAKGGAVLCEDCMSSNQKKALKAEHTNRLKAAFVKALQQEQEIEQRIIQQASSPVSHGTSSAAAASSLKAEQLVSQQLKQARVSSLQHHHHQASRGAIPHHHSIKQSSQGHLSRGVSSMGSSKVSSSGIGGGRNASGGSASAAAWKKQSSSNAGRLALRPGPALAPDISSLSTSCLVLKQSFSAFTPIFNNGQTRSKH
uniref:GATA zinc finger domain containing 2A n=1 Tax=Fundulus heteroclitus TaxID=8078 RepID=A0A3Q2NS08_FUNHE